MWGDDNQKQSRGIHAKCECAGQRETAKRRVAGVTGCPQEAVATPANAGLGLPSDGNGTCVTVSFLKEAVLHPGMTGCFFS